MSDKIKNEHGNFNHNILFNSIKVFSSVLFPLITFPYIVKTLGVENLGRVNFVFAIISFAMLFSNLGLSSYAIRELSKTDVGMNKKNIASEIFSINFITMIIVYVSLSILLIFTDVFKDYRNLIAINSFVIFANFIGAEWINKSSEDFKFFSVLSIFVEFVSIFFIIFLVQSSSDYVNYIIVITASSSIPLIINIFHRKKYFKLDLVFSSNSKHHFYGMITLFALLLSNLVFSQTDIVMIGYFYDNLQVGLYSFAYKIFNLINLLSASLVFVFLPTITKYVSRIDTKNIKKLLNTALSVLVGLNLPSAIGLILYSEELIYLIADYTYIDSRMLIVLFGLNLVVTIFSGFYANMIILPYGEDKFYLTTAVIAALSNLILNLYFLPKFGLFAAVLTTITAQLIVFVLSFIKSRKLIKFRIDLKDFTATLIISFILIASSFLKHIFITSNVHFVIFLILCIIIYAILIFREKKSLYNIIFSFILKKEV
jgi:O-antigen/teichoic acid export membrane protein